MKKKLNLYIWSQRTFWYCNDVGVISPSISPWHCWYIVNEKHDDVNLRYQPDSGSWDWANQTLMLSWHRRDNRRYPAERDPSGSYTTSVSATIMPRLYCGNWKIKASGDFFLSCCCKKFVIFFSNNATQLKSYF